MRKTLLVFLFLFITVGVSYAAHTIFNPFTGKLDFVDVKQTPPYNPSDPGSPGDIAYDGSYIYVCVSANTWVRASLTTWSIIRVPVLWQGVQVKWQGVDVQR